MVERIFNLIKDKYKNLTEDQYAYILHWSPSFGSYIYLLVIEKGQVEVTHKNGSQTHTSLRKSVEDWCNRFTNEELDEFIEDYNYVHRTNY